ncbi:class I SAM-dependent methyltransferase [Chloroflexota bacterium]
MGYFDDKKNVEEYIKMAEGFDGRELIQILKKYLKKGASVLELGMGPGKDFEILREHYQVTGSDNSAAFVERYRKKDRSADVLLLNATTMGIERKFDGVYSNKVLHHLTKQELKESFKRQAEILNRDGILFHSLWYGDKEEEMSGLRFVYYTEETFGTIVGDEYEVVASERYTEMEPDDSIYFVLRKRVLRKR